MRYWFKNKAPLVEREQKFIKQKEDLVSVSSAREWGMFDGFVESLLLKVDCKLVQVSRQNLNTLNPTLRIGSGSSLPKNFVTKPRTKTSVTMLGLESINLSASSSQASSLYSLSYLLSPCTSSQQSVSRSHRSRLSAPLESWSSSRCCSLLPCLFSQRR